MNPQHVRVTETACLPFRGAPKATPLYSEMKFWPEDAIPGHFIYHDLEEAREKLCKLGFLPKVQRSHKAELKRLTVHHPHLVIRKETEHAKELGEFMAHFGEPYYGQSLSTCVNLILQKLLRQKRRAASSEEKVQAFRKQDGKCEHCACELDETLEMDPYVPVKNAVAKQPVLWRALCKPCHALLSDREGGRKNPSCLRSMQTSMRRS